MNTQRIGIILIFIFVAGVILANSFFIVSQTEQALVLRFGKPVNIVTSPGLKFKVPMVDSVQKYEKRIVALNAEPKTVILRDQDRLIVDAFITYRIVNPLKFYQTVREERIMNTRLESILEKSLRDVLGSEDLSTLLSPKRSQIMETVRDKVSRLSSGQSEDGTASATHTKEEAAAQADAEQNMGFGIQVVDVRILRTDLPKETSDPIYNRMRSDRQRVAEQFRAEGQRESQIIRAEADRERTVLLAQAEKQSSILRGEGDGEATRIFAEAFGSDEEFYGFYRTMQAYRNSLKKEDTTVILSPQSDFLRYLGKAQ